jgi:hypothetical protein
MSNVFIFKQNHLKLFDNELIALIFLKSFLNISKKFELNDK